MSATRLMKDGLGIEALNRIADGLSAVSPEFNRRAFLIRARKNLGSLELKQRVVHIIHIAHDFLPDDFEVTAKALRQLPQVWNYGDVDNPLRGFAAWPIIDYISVYGLNHPQQSLATLKTLTGLFSAEFAVRPFIQLHFKYTYRQLQEWVESDNEHVRRLVSESTRPRLPWGIRLTEFIKDPKPILPLLEKLKSDESLYVRRSVANNLNDISKDHPEKVISICRRWKKDNNEYSNWIVKHATRTLVKNGHAEVFALLGYNNKTDIKISRFRITPKKIKVGQSIAFCFEIQAGNRKQEFVLDYAIHYRKANKKLVPKIFKLKNCRLKKNEILTISRSHSFKPITTRKYYPGEHLIALHINGVEFSRLPFHLTM